MAFTDKVLKCRDCGVEFVFTVGEQAFYAEKGFTNEPTRCRDCRTARKRDRGGDSRSQESGFSNARPTVQRRMYKAVCAECGTETEVPFQPRGDRPVYCRECFAAQRQAY